MPGSTQNDSIRLELIAWIQRLDDQGLLKALQGLKKLVQRSADKPGLTSKERETIAAELGSIGHSSEERDFWKEVATHGLQRAYSAEEPDISGITLLEPNPTYKP